VAILLRPLVVPSYVGEYLFDTLKIGWVGPEIKLCGLGIALMAPNGWFNHERTEADSTPRSRHGSNG